MKNKFEETWEKCKTWEDIQCPHESTIDIVFLPKEKKDWTKFPFRNYPFQNTQQELEKARACCKECKFFVEKKQI